MSACQIRLLSWASNFLCAGGTSSWRSVSRCCLRKRYSVEADTPGEFRPEDRASSRNRVEPDPEGAPVRVFAFETFDEVGELRGRGARMAAVLPRFGRQGLETTGAVAERPIQQRIDGNRNALGTGNVVVTGGHLLGAAGEFSAGKSFEHQRGYQAVSKQGEFFSFGVHERTIRGIRAWRDANAVCLRSGGWESRPERGGTPVRNERVRPA